MKHYTIGQLAKLARLSTVTIRYYERFGIINQAQRRDNQYRYYPADTLKQLQFIQNAKAAGFTLHEIKWLQSLRDQPKANADDIKLFIEKKMLDINTKIQALTSIKHLLGKLNQSCQGGIPIDQCPIIKSLDDDMDSEK